MNRKHLAIVASFASLWFTLPDASAQAVSTITTPTNGGTDLFEPEIIPSRDTAGPDVGISSRDGITYSVPDVLVTRNGVTQRLTSQLRLANGTRVLPNGTVILPDGGRVMIKPEQVLSFSGTFENAPIAEAVVDTTDTMTAELIRRANSGAARPAAGQWRELPTK